MGKHLGHMDRGGNLEPHSWMDWLGGGIQLPSCVQFFATLWTAAHQVFLVPHHLPEFTQVHVH